MSPQPQTPPEASAMEAVDLEKLLKLRLAVARFGEMDRAGWWNTKGMLGSLGKAVLSRGFPQTHFLAQAQVVFAVATRRCAEVFSPPGHFTLWSLPAALEDAFREQWMDWRDRVDSLRPFFESLEAMDNPDLLDALQGFSLIDDSQRETIKRLRVSAMGNAVLIPGVHKLDDHILTLLAAGFARGAKGQPIIPYASLEVPA